MRDSKSRRRETNCVGAICWINSRAIKEESDTRQSLALALAEGIHQLAELSGTFDFEEHFIIVIRL